MRKGEIETGNLAGAHEMLISSVGFNAAQISRVIEKTLP